MAKNARKGTKKEKEESPWKQYDIEQYRKLAEIMVHFSFKTVNSNASTGGVRLLSKEDGLSLPYVSARTMMEQGVPISMDYPGNAANAGIARQIKAVIEEKQPDSENAAESIRVVCQTALAARNELNCGTVSPRMRQMLIPKGNDYVAITPVGAGGLSEIINKRIEAHNQNNNYESGLVRLQQAQLGIGGTKPLNVGGLAYEMQHPLYFESPSEPKEIKVVLSFHYKGIPLTIPRDLAVEYRTWREAEKAKNQGRIPTDMRTREKEEEFSKRFAAAVLSRGERALIVLENHKECLPDGGDSLMSNKVDPVVRGVIDPSERSGEWPRRFSRRLANQIAAYDFRDEQGGLGLDDGAIVQIAKWIEEGLR